MEDFKLFAKVMAMLMACENGTPWEESLLSPESLGISPEKQVATLKRLQEDGLIRGVTFTRYIHQQEETAAFAQKPYVTIAGLQFMEENSLFKKAAQEVKAALASAAAQTAAHILSNNLK